MSVASIDVSPGPEPTLVRTAQGEILSVPTGWELLPPGDALLTRRVKAAGPTWTVKEKRGRKVFSRGVWAPAENIARARVEVDAQREDPAYARKLEAGRKRRANEQEAYEAEFERAVLAFLGFAPCHAEIAAVLAREITEHAVPVGSNTVARTQRIPIEQRAEAATIAWMRHQTTAYDSMSIPRVKGMRRETRRLLAARSRELLACYRRPGAVDPATCPLRQALSPFVDS